jgi:CRISPR/Cas system CMR subunit Cmr6 (Cas7 group RAMP superfamily)
MNFETISNEFNNILTQYQETYKKYISNLNSTNNTLSIIPNTTLLGQTTISSTQEINVDACQSKCSSTSNCNGAIFDANKNCLLGSGNPEIIPTTNSNSIVKMSLYYSYQLQQLNNKLLILKQQMIYLTNQNSNEFEKNNKITAQQNEMIQQNYQILIGEKDKINGMIRQFQTLNESYKDGSLNVTSNYYKYIVLLFITLLLVIVLIKYSIIDSQRGGGKVFYRESGFLFSIMVLFLLLSQIVNIYYVLLY